VTQTKNTQSGSNGARAGLNRDQARRGTTLGATNRGRGSAVASGAAPARPAMPLAGAGGRRGRGNPLDFIRDVRSELRKVAWPSQRETVNLTAVVIAFSVAVGLFLGGIDYVFQELFRLLLGIGQGGGL
jgi:preprotein translocase subunit SecE